MKTRLLRGCALALALMLSPVARCETQTQAPVDMLEVDHRLFELGYRDDNCNGVLDAVTQGALKNFQIVNRLEVTQQADAPTVERLMSDQAISMREYLSALSLENTNKGVLSNGAYGDAVLRLQRALKELGYFSGECDGAYGDATTTAVYRFQLANGLQLSGMANGALVYRLYSGAPLSWDRYLSESCASAGDAGVNVRRIQLALKGMGLYKGACTGRYGESTQQAVKRFQNRNNLDSSGDVDMDCCRALFSDVGALLANETAIRPGETGADAAALCARLSELGYPAADSFNARTELALMLFQFVNSLEPSGSADAATLLRLQSPDAFSLDSYIPDNRALEVSEEQRRAMARQAAALLGQMPGFESGFEWIQYVYFKCGLTLTDRGQLEVSYIDDAAKIGAGETLILELEGGEIYGISTSDGAVVYQSGGGYVVMRYLSSLADARVSVCRAGA